MSQEALLAALQNKAGFEAVDKHNSANQLRLFGRVSPQKMPMWLETIRSLLLASDRAGWNLDVSRQYFLRGEKLFFGWRLILQGNNIEQHISAAHAVVQQVRVAAREIEEVPLNARPDRNALRNGRGAQEMGKAIVGPAARR